MCLLGERVRHDGGHKRNSYVTDTLARFVEWVPVCPEVEVGLGTPREAIHLVQREGEVRLVGVRSRTDHTAAMRQYARRRVEALAAERLSGFILKKDSPSCGLDRVRVHHGPGSVSRTGRGLFAAALVERFPNLPIEEEGRLCDPRLRENWVERVFAYHRLQALWAARWRIGDLVQFHTAHKLLLMAHSPQHHTRLGRLVAEARVPSAGLRAQYEREFMAVLTRLATRGRHANVLQHILGHFRNRLDGPVRSEILALIEDYRRGLVPLVVPLTLVAHYVRVLGIDYLARQVYLEPHPKELALRNHV